MSYIIYLLKHLLDLPLTIIWNFILFPIPVACRLPVLFSHKIKIQRLTKGNIVLKGEVRPFGIKIGVEGVDGVAPERKSYINLGKNARLVFNGKANLAKGVSLRCESGTIEFGKNFYSNCNMSVICSQHVSFGDDALIGWCVNIRDCDGHSIFCEGVETPSVKPVAIGNHVWIGAYVDILKGVTIGDGSIVAYRSCVLKAIPQERVLLGGYPARILKENVDWHV